MTDDRQPRADTRIELRLPSALAAELRSAARSEDRSVSAEARRAFRLYLQTTPSHHRSETT